MASKTALLLGSTGETGKEVLKLLVTTSVYGKVVCLGRRVVELPQGEGWERVEQKVVDFDNLAQQISEKGTSISDSCG
jgi:oxidoreductase